MRVGCDRRAAALGATAALIDVCANAMTADELRQEKSKSQCSTAERLELRIMVNAWPNATTYPLSAQRGSSEKRQISMPHDRRHYENEVANALPTIFAIIYPAISS